MKCKRGRATEERLDCSRGRGRRAELTEHIPQSVEQGLLKA